MKQKTYFVKSIDEMKQRITEVREIEEYSSASSILVLLYVDGYVLHETQEYVDLLHKLIPEAIVAGMSVINSTEDWKELGISVSFMMFESSKVDLYTYPSSEYTEEEVIELFTKELNFTQDARVVLTYPADSTRDFTKILDAISEGIDSTVTFFGSMAGASMYLDPEGFGYNHEIIELGRERSANVDINEKYGGELPKITYSIGEELIDSGFVFVVLSGERLHESAKYVFGWNSLGKGMKITGSIKRDDLGSYCISEIDGMPATQIYKKYLDVDVDDFFMDNVCEFPITVKRDDTTVGRVPLYAGYNGELFFAGDIKDNEEIKLSFAIPLELLNISQKAAREVGEFNPEAVLLSVCFNRYHFLKERSREEIQFFADIHKELLFGYGGSEILRSQGTGGILNSAIVALALREGDQIRDKRSVTVRIEEEKRAVKPLLDRLISFINTSSNELEEAYEAAKQASKSKSSFLSNMSHEIRTPINAVLGMNEMIIREANDEQILGYSRDIKTAGLNLLRIVNDILDFSKIEAGKMEIVPVEYELASVLNDLVNMIKKRLDDKGLSFRLNIDPTIPHLLYGDEIRIKQVVTNILTNAVKYTEKGGIILGIRAKECLLEDNYQTEEDTSINSGENCECPGKKILTMQISVEDTGIGIKPEDKEKLFNSFERVDEVRNRTIEGTGLGMSITQNLLKLMGSELKMESEYGVGSIFYFDLKQKVVDETPIGNFDDALRRSISTTEEYRESFVAPEARVLVVDDTEINLTVFKNLLKQTKLKIDTALSGKECLEMLNCDKYDIIFLDHRMPEMDGIECLKHIKDDKDGINYETPVIALTANAVSGSREIYLNAGFDGYLTKPIQAGLLEKMIVDYLPSEKVTLVQAGSENDEEVPYWIKKAPFINEKIGIDNCGGVAAYLKALRSYSEAVDDIDRYIESAWKDGRIVDYTTKVHALKSSSRIVGAMEIGALAESLEIAGDIKDKSTIDQLTDELLIYHNALGSLLKCYLEQNSKADDEGKEKISGEKLEEAYMAIKEMAQMFDYDSVSAIMDSLSEYSLPEAERSRYEDLKKAVKDADWDAINRIMEGI